MFDTEEEFDRCKTAFDGSMILNRHRGNASADLAFVGNDKGNAIRLLTKHANIDLKDTIAFGDGNNDVSIYDFIKKNSWLLSYSKNKKVKIVKLFHKLFGMKITLFLLKLFLTIK